jgi:lysozyme
MNRIQKGGAGLVALAVATVGGFEGVRYVAYPDPATHGAPFTVCDGHTGPDVKLGVRYTQAQCKALLLKDLSKEASQIERCIPSLKDAPDARYVAVLDLAHNIGGAGVCYSSVARDLNAGHVEQACDDILKFKYAAGRVLPGLVRRRDEERSLCLE